MPELPEIEIVKRSLVKSVKNAKIIDIKINNRNLRYKIPRSFSKNLINQKILKISRRSKYLIFNFKKKILLVHLGMSGKILLKKKNHDKLYKTSFYYDSNVSLKPGVVKFKYNNNLWLVGTHPGQSYIGSFCANNGSMFDEDSYNIHATGLSLQHGYYYNLYGLRLARTTQ